MEISTSQLPLTCLRKPKHGRSSEAYREHTSLIQEYALRPFTDDNKVEGTKLVYDSNLVSLFHPSGRTNKKWFLREIGRTYWFPRLKRGIKITLLKLLSKGKYVSTFKEVLSTVDSILMSLILAIPNLGWRYEFTDAIQRSVISQCVINFSHFLKSRKEFLKEVRKNFLNGIGPPPIPRNLSWYTLPVRYAFSHQGTPRGLYIIATMCNTRSSGLPPREMVDESVKKFIDTTSLPNKEVKLDYQVLDRIDLHRRSDDVNWSIRSKIVVSTTACYEVGQKSNGKYKALQLIDQVNDDVVIDLETGDERKLKPPNIGERVFHKCLSLVSRNGIDRYLDVNLSTVREPGKARTITSSSAVHATVLQPLSHLLLEWLKSIPELHSGLKLERDAWECYTSLGSNLDTNREWIYRSKAFCFDLETATDYGNWNVGRQLYDWITNHLGIPKFYREICSKLLFSPRPVWFRGKHIHTTKRGWLMGDPVTKVILTLAQYYCYLASNYPSGQTHARFKGDNGVVITRDEEAYKRHVRSIREIDLVLSESDHLWSDFVFYGEFAFIIPKNRYMFWDSVRRTPISVRGNCPYIDTVRIRLLNQVFKDRSEFGYDPKGKIFLLGKESIWTRYPPGSPEWFAFELGLFIQYNVLRPKDIADFLPSSLGGNNLHPPFWQVENIPPVRAGELRTLYSELGRELHMLPEHSPGFIWLDPVKYPLLGNPDLFKIIRRIKVHKGLETDVFFAKEDIDLSEYDRFLVYTETQGRQFGFVPFTPDTVNNFCHEKEVVAAVLARDRLLQFNTGDDPEEEPQDLDMFENKILGPIKDNPPEERFIKYLLDVWSKESYKLRHLSLSKIYDRKVIDCIMGNGELSLNIHIPVKDTHGLLENLSFREREARRLVEAIEKKDWINIPSELLSDDEVIKFKVKEYLNIALVNNKPVQIVIETDDKKLVNEIINDYAGYIRQSRSVIMRQGLEDLYVNCVMVEPLNNFEYVYIQDTGSLRGFEENHFIDGVYIPPSKGHPAFRTNFDSPWLYDDELRDLIKKSISD
jgi:hypothetical protein